MAKLTFNIATNMTALQSYGGSIALETPNEVLVTAGANSNVYFGNNLTYSNGTVTGGTFNSYAQVANGTTTTTLTGFSISAASYAQQVSTSNLGALLALTLTGGDTIIGSSSNDTLIGYASGDTFMGGAGNNTINATGTGNVAVEDCGYTQAKVTPGFVTTVVARPDGTDTLNNVQTVQFADGRLAFSPNRRCSEGGASVSGRPWPEPDQEGLSYWTNALDNGASLTSLAQSFIGSAEFTSRYPAAANGTNAAFVNQLYENVLGRPADAAGSTYWVGQLSTGTQTRAQVLTDFSESNENLSNTSLTTASGIWVTDATAAQIARLYDTAFSRLPDVAGLTSWETAIKTGQDTLIQVADSFVNSAEFQAKYGSLNNTSFVTALYNNTLHRAPDAAGLTYWVTNLNAGADRGAAVVGFSESAEHISNTFANVYGSNGVNGITFTS